MKTRKTSVALDERLFAATRAALRTRGVRETIEGAFRELLRDRARRAEVVALGEMDGMDLADAAVMSGAWRH